MDLIIHTRDDKIIKYPLTSFVNMDEFYLKNLIEDTKDTSEIHIDEDYDIIICILDSLRYNKFIFNKDTNLSLMERVCDKWCCPEWLSRAIEDELYSSKKLMKVNRFLDTLTNNVYRCLNCNTGFNKYNNKPNSCRTHRCCTTIAGTNRYACCNKEEPCQVGYHVVNISDINVTLMRIKDLGFE